MNKKPKKKPIKKAPPVKKAVLFAVRVKTATDTYAWPVGTFLMWSNEPVPQLISCGFANGNVYGNEMIARSAADDMERWFNTELGMCTGSTMTTEVVKFEEVT